jgi:prepilin peptidase CpaA
MQYAVCALFLAMVVAAGLQDLLARRIPNWLTVGGACVGLGLTLVSGGNAIQAGAGLLVALGVGFTLYAMRLLGAGDAKLMAAIGTWAGLTRLPEAFFAMLAGGALLAVVWVVRGRVLQASLLSTTAILDDMVHGRTPGPALVGRTAAGKFPYGVGLGLGAAVWWLWAGCALP